MSVETETTFRGTFVQGTSNSLILKVHEFDGTPFDPIDVNVETTRDSDGEIIFTRTPDKVTTGVYAAEWDVDSDEEEGKYTITWSFEANGVDQTQIQKVVVAESSTSASTFYSGKTLLMRQSLELMLDCAQQIPVYSQQAQPSRDRKTFRWTKGLWNPHPGTRIYLNQEIVTEGLTINYHKGSVTFDEPLTPYDVVEADYNFRWFSDIQFDRFLSNALHTVNVYPPHTGYSVVTLPEKYIAVTLYLAAKDAIRTLMMCLQFEEPVQFFGGKEEASKRFQQLETLKKNYEDDANNLLEQKKYFPYAGLTRAVVVPEYTLPGGRSRWFRYLFKGQG